jgi:hypothetical protein
LQRNQRDNARQNIANRVKAEIETYAGNNQGLYPFQVGGACAANTTGCWVNFYNNYVQGGKVKVTDPSSGNDVFTGAPAASCTATANAGGHVCGWTAGAAFSTTAGDFSVVYGAKCNGENVVASGSANATTRTYAVLITLDRGTHYCIDNG